MKVDAHQHYWHYSPEQYPWMGPELSLLARDFLPQDVAPQLRAQGFDACIAVQARAIEAESDYLLGLARQHPWIAGVVGWTDLAAPDVGERLQALRTQPKLVGIRHLLQDEADPATWCANPAINRGLAQTQAQGLVYEVLVKQQQMAQAVSLCAQHGEHWMVLDHLGKPRLGEPGAFADWQRHLAELAAMPHVAVKLSGLVTEARAPEDAGVHSPVLRRHLFTALELFGPQRLIFGSDWPVCQLVAGYEHVYRIIDDWAASLTVAERADLWGSNAARIYRLPPALAGIPADH